MTIRIERPTELINGIRKYKIFVDGKHLDDLANSAHKEIHVPTESETIQCRIDWCGSNTLNLRKCDGENLRLTVSGSLLAKICFFLGAVTLFVAIFFSDGTPRTVLQCASGIALLYPITLGRNRFLSLKIMK